MLLKLVIIWSFAGLFLIIRGQQDFPYFYPQWENNGEPWEGDCDRPNYICPADKPWECWQPPFCPYHQIKVSIENIGYVIGRSMVYMPNRFINIFMGVPYAKPPVYERRFKPPEDPGPGWDLNVREWDASYFRPACPQEIWEIQDSFYETRNVSEDCLYLNIYRPNLTDRVPAQNKNYPVVLFIHGEDYKLGDAQLYPGHILAKKEVLVVTFNYRLGALGFLSTQDDNLPGNYGIYDVLKALEFINKNIKEFGGDPDRVTLIGSGSGAAIAGILTLSPKSYLYGYKQLFHKVILMSGTDRCEWAIVTDVWNVNARDYAKQLGKKVGCDPYYGLPLDRMADCLRWKHFEEIVNASAAVYKAYGSLAGPFGPVVDGDDGILPASPEVLRANKQFMKIEVMAGVDKDEGSFIVDNITKDIIGLKMEEGMDPGTFRDVLWKMVHDRRSVIKNVNDVVDAMEYEYTFWAKPDNTTAVRQNLIDLWSDMMYGWCMDAVLKAHAGVDYSVLDPTPPVYMYVFDHRSEYEPLSHWMGVPHSKAVEYLFGFPFFNTTLGNITGIVPHQWDWNYLDKNISEFVQDMWVNFTRYGTPTVEWTRNVSWYPFSLQNLSYLTITEFAYMDINFRQNHYAFWREYFPSLSARWPVTTTPGPTPRPNIEYQFATYSMMGASIVIICVIGGLGITLWRRRKSSDEKDY